MPGSLVGHLAPSSFGLVGESPAIRKIRRFVRMAAPVDASVLITGETGTGKSLLARILHRQSPRRENPVVVVNCAGVPEGLFESEFFGHEKGAFTGAHQAREGLFELAHGGTLFMDEVGDLPLAQQAKLLAVLEERTIRRVGGSRSLEVDVRVISATSRDLATALDSGAFRRDLYHRVAVLRCHLPPLRERPEDLLPLTRHLLDALRRKHGMKRCRLTSEAREALRERPWPGNVRELAHLLEAALILAEGKDVRPHHLEEAAPGPAPSGKASGG